MDEIEHLIKSPAADPKTKPSGVRLKKFIMGLATGLLCILLLGLAVGAVAFFLNAYQQSRQIEDRSRRVTQKEETLADYEARKMSLQDDLNRLSSEVEILRKEKAELEPQVAMQSQVISEYRILVNAIPVEKERLESIQTFVQEQEDKAAQVSVRLQELLANQQESQTRFETLRTELELKTPQLATLQLTLETLNQEVESLGRQKQLLLEETQTLTTRRSGLVQDLRDLETHLAELNQQRETLQTQIQGQQTRTNLLTAEINSLTQEIGTLRSNQQDLQTAIQTLQTKKRTAEDELAGLERLRSEHAELTTSVAVLETRRTRSEEDLASLENDQIQKQAALARTKRELQNLEQRIKELSNQQTLLTGENQQLSQTQAELTTQIAVLNERAVLLRSNSPGIEEIEVQISGLQELVTRQMTIRIADLETRLKQLQEEIRRKPDPISTANEIKLTTQDEGESQ